ncbi:ferritin-like domain-containing protein [Krasilnikovia sp. MM14-A1259]|uniref:ferritin-like domain-containing protein n=1 Tax=Krasilnikovia sp. MM14-A1259 TaxID=3373539 RepID=UPI0037F633D7
MSVLDVPRVHFRGVATMKLPTGPRSGLVDLATNRALTDTGPFPVDQPVEDYHRYLDQHGPRFDTAGRVTPDGPFSVGKGWNFAGNGHFWIDATVAAVEIGDGVDVRDPVVGRPVDFWGHYNEYLGTTFNRARIFDVDPTSHWTTAVMIGQFCFGRRGRSHENGYLAVGDVTGIQPPRWHHFAHIRDVGEHHLAPYLRRSAVYQFVVAGQGLHWLPESAASPAARLLCAAVESARFDGLVVQFALGNMAAPVAPDAPNHCAVWGTIAPWRHDEPRTYPAGRLLAPAADRPAPLGTLTVAVTPRWTTLNMINAVPVTVRADTPGPGPLHRLGPRADLGELELRSRDRVVALIPRDAYLGEAFDLTSGVVRVPTILHDRGVDSEPLCLVATAADERLTLLSEEQVSIQADDACWFVEHPRPAHEHEHTVEVEIRSFVRGRPAAVEAVHVRQFPNPRSRPYDREGTDVVRLRAGRLDADGEFGASCVTRTDAGGRGWFSMRGAHGGAARLVLDTRADPVPGDAAEAYDNDDALGRWSAAGTLAVRTLPDDWHLAGTPDEAVTFDLVYREVFAYYELLYSFMRAEVFSLADRPKVETYARLIWQMCDPRNKARTYYMPPTRDLSAPKAHLLLTFLRRQQQQSRVPIFVPAGERPEPRIATRGQLLDALRQAAAIELAVMLQYLYAVYSIPTYGAAQEYRRRGRWTPEQARLACGDGGKSLAGGVRGSLLTVAREEMIHFLVINNIIMALGEAFHVPMLDFGMINNSLPVPMDFALEPFNLGTTQRFIAIERPYSQTGRLTDAEPPDPESTHRYGSLSELYDAVRDGLRRVPDLFLVDRGRGGGEHHLFLRESVNAVHPDYQLEVDDLASALFAIDVVTEQGEGGKLSSVKPAGDSHYETFLGIADALMAQRPAGSPRAEVWTPAYPVPRNPTLRTGNPNTEPVTAPEARTVLHLFNRSFFMMFQLMVQHFGQQPDASLRRSTLMNAAIDVMTGMMGPLAEVLVTLPSGRRGRTAGPSFELETAPVYLSRPDVAMRSIALRFDHLATAARKCASVPEKVADMFAFYADAFGRLPR